MLSLASANSDLLQSQNQSQLQRRSNFLFLIMGGRHMLAPIFFARMRSPRDMWTSTKGSEVNNYVGGAAGLDFAGLHA